MKVVHRGAIFHLLDNPRRRGDGACEYFVDGALVIEDGHVSNIGPWETIAPALPAGTPVHAHPGALVTPGFIDAHVHYPQTDIIASPGGPLLEWLDRFTYPAETRFVVGAVARETADFFLAELLRNGTTSALVFATIHDVAVEALFAAAEARGMRLITGKVLMDEGAPAGLLAPAGPATSASAALIRRWHGRGRLGYAVSPRFAGACSAEQLAAAGALVAANPSVHMQTHLSENRAELALVAARHPEARDYLGVYEAHGLVTARSVFGHGVHLSESERGRLGAAGAAIAFCPTSNLFLGSGLFDLAATQACDVAVALGTDIGAGTTFSMFATMNEAYKIGRLQGRSLSAMEAFYLATLGAARALRLDAQIGNLAAGKEADFLVLDLAATPLLARRLNAAATLEERLFVLAMLGDDRVVAETYIAGVCAHRRDRRHG